MNGTSLRERFKMKKEGDYWIRDGLSWKAVYSQVVPAMYSHLAQYEALSWYFIGDVPTETGFSIGNMLQRGAWVDRKHRQLVILGVGCVMLEEFESDEELEGKIQQLRSWVTEALVRCRNCDGEVSAQSLECPKCCHRI